VKAALLADADVNDDSINVEVNQGQVTLTGNVQSQQQHDQALEVARSVDGVRDVQSNLQVGN
jgi:hyperosmotically inducible protein